MPALSCQEVESMMAEMMPSTMLEPMEEEYYDEMSEPSE